MNLIRMWANTIKESYDIYGVEESNVKSDNHFIADKYDESRAKEFSPANIWQGLKNYFKDSIYEKLDWELEFGEYVETVDHDGGEHGGNFDEIQFKGKYKPLNSMKTVTVRSFFEFCDDPKNGIDPYKSIDRYSGFDYFEGWDFDVNDSKKTITVFEYGN